MKKIIKLLCIAALLGSCTKTAVIGRQEPFIIADIESKSDGMCYYYGTYSSGTDGIWKPVIIMPRGKYNVGDTVKIEHFN